MNELIALLKDIFMISDESSKFKTGLCQFNQEKNKTVSKKTEKLQKEICISDLLRKTV
ncbi:hypothetical protein J6P92_03970 [bacterium]|nr:hypothetical protein [bacterium]